MYLILLDVAKLASKITVSIDTPTNSVEDNMDFGVGRSEFNPASHLTAVEPSFSVPIGNMRIMLWIDPVRANQGYYFWEICSGKKQVGSFWLELKLRRGEPGVAHGDLTTTWREPVGKLSSY